MKHEERIKLANQAAKKLLEKYGSEIIYIGLYGSTARNEDKPHSDVELIVITKNKNGLQYYPLKDVLLFVGFKTLDEADNIIKNISDSWPVEAGQIMSSNPLYDKDGLIGRYRMHIKNMNQNDFIKTAEKVLVWVVEDVGKIMNAYESGNMEKMREELLINFAAKLNWFVALINRRYFSRSEYGALKDIEAFENLPEDFVKLSSVFWRSNSLNEMYETAMQLWKNCLVFAEEYDIRIKTYNSIEEIKF